MPPKLSIITINLNNASGLQKTIASVMAQTSKDFEYIIIDGGSTDGSVEVIESFSNTPPGQYVVEPASAPSQTKRSSVAYWISEPDTGIYNAMNKGIRFASGEYCQFLNSGDWLTSPRVTELMLAQAPDKGILVGNMVKILPNGKVFSDKGIANQKPTFLTFYKGTLNHSSAYIHRDLFYRYGMYDESLKIVSDWKWYLQVVGINNEPVKYIDLDVTCFDMTGISTLNSTLDKTERRKALEQLIPSNILADYDAHWHSIEQAMRVNRYPMTRWVFWLVERVLFKLEKVGQKYEKIYRPK